MAQKSDSRREPVLPAARAVGKMIAAVVWLIGIAGMPDDLSTWSEWVAWLDPGWVRFVSTVVGVPIMALYVYPRWLDRIPITDCGGFRFATPTTLERASICFANEGPPTSIEVSQSIRNHGVLGHLSRAYAHACRVATRSVPLPTRQLWRTRAQSSSAAYPQWCATVSHASSRRANKSSHPGGKSVSQRKVIARTLPRHARGPWAGAAAVQCG